MAELGAGKQKRNHGLSVLDPAVADHFEDLGKGKSLDSQKLIVLELLANVREFCG